MSKIFYILELSVLVISKNKMKNYLHIYQTKIIELTNKQVTKFETFNQQ